MHPTLLIALCFVIGMVLGFLSRIIFSLIRKNSIETIISSRLLSAREEAQKILSAAQEAQLTLLTKEKKLDEQKSVLQEKINIQEKKLSEIAGISKEDAYQKMVQQLREEHEQDMLVRIKKFEQHTESFLQERAKEILVSSMQKIAATTTSEHTSTVVHTTSEDDKAKIIGRDGRNIKTFEQVSGTELLVDEVPSGITISCFDPVRRAIAKKALETLLADGRIQPSRIEEVLIQAKQEVHTLIKEYGVKAVQECGITALDPNLIALLGRLHFRTSYGQNVLAHSIEVSHLAGMIAEEIGANKMIAKTAGLLHDIGKALDHEFEGTHISLGMRVLRKFSVDEQVITAMKSHHDDVPHESLEAVLVQVADTISASRPGARKNSIEKYLNRLSELEELANKFSGIEKVYAFGAGRELRVFVHPENISDIAAKKLARDIALQIESEMQYPGEIKITIIRETRVIDYAR